LEIATDKMLTTQILTQKKIPNPDTIMCESADLAIQAFYELGEDIVIKPLYGSRGRGVFRIQDPNHATLVFHQLEQINNVFYVQRYMEHNNVDFRLFVLGGQVIASMKRKSNNWKTNIARGAIPESYNPSGEMMELAIRSAEAVQGEIIGVDIMQTQDGLMVVEVNAVPGFIGLQEVTPFNISDKIIEYLITRGKL
jgi:RimK family alpha-L-glutamate ligase